MRHGYTNHTSGDAARVEKTYQGPDAQTRLARERGMLELLQGLFPVPAILAAGRDGLSLELLPGAHGQDLIAQGHATPVLRSTGQLLHRLHTLPRDYLGLPSTAGTVLVHGDFGPNNILFDPESFAVTALLDWEFARVGQPVEDLAWCEWIVRMHHPEHRDALEEFFAGYGRPVPDWPERRAAMVARCQELEQFCRRWEPDGAGARQWVQRAAVTASWRE